jgi:hypothetical protein
MLMATLTFWVEWKIEAIFGFPEKIINVCLDHIERLENWRLNRGSGRGQMETETLPAKGKLKPCRRRCRKRGHTLLES